MKSVNQENYVIQDNWSNWQSELTIANRLYYMSTQQDGHTYFGDGFVQVTPTKYILSSNSENPFGDFSETYVDRITGRFYSYEVRDDGVITTVLSEGVCHLVELPKPKF